MMLFGGAASDVFMWGDGRCAFPLFGLVEEVAYFLVLVHESDRLVLIEVLHGRAFG